MLAVIGRFGRIGEETGGFEDHIDTFLIPRDHSGIAFSEDRDLLSVDRNVFVVVADRSVKIAVRRVIFQKVCICLGVG